MGERIKVPLDGRKKGVHLDRKRGGSALLLLELTPNIEEASRSPALITNTTTRYNELTEESKLDPHIGKWSTQTLREVKTPEPSSKP
jgi:hypothetical protein